MIAMQYSFTLPSDYDMSIIDRRVAEKGHALDNHQPLILKAYNVARQDDWVTKGNENLYAPFYVWKDALGMSDFLCSAGFKGLVKSFGWPTVRTWPVVLVNDHADMKEAGYATRELFQLSPFVALDELRASEALLATTAMEEGAVSAIAAFEPTTWSLVRFRGWRITPPTSAGSQAYEVAHVSLPPRQ